jgi:5-methylcytosine-specific restriction endonuclease McrA
LELVKFDTALLADPTLVGLAYQHGTREGMEIREYLLYKWQRRCASCHQPSDRFELEHLIPRGRGGSDRISNLVLACHACNQAKGEQTAEKFGHGH